MVFEKPEVTSFVAKRQKATLSSANPLARGESAALHVASSNHQ